MQKLSNPHSYTLIVGLILFCLGFFGFIFRSYFNVPNHYLVFSLILGFWGILVAVGNKHEHK
ncbi:MAG: hypothetical protein COT92_03205 [Candidatus Doudnabacteria bacterium CG10_big_fil_rev_8_21_14_0_10_42_18]|uniref:Uncharacterized protein n=1 Tax=Candidatus Doudnabacteria bacterium CG10_big_fil_rev_8_21_14_0_10_42_18 TaxID=1974552 RepID=A0A2H0VAD8_9BACT|nr:MAG: hypothetical protein COT92_03205 [Candidatus Doudnabacteria bacterium CG10_big_fil_rev_8_21_14_0_10_42_18]